jgi:PAS domain S-box-containing protein
VDAQGLYTYVSPVSISVLGYRPDELVGRMHFYDLHPAAGREAFKASALAVFARQEPFFNLVNPAQTKSGRQVWFSTNGSAHFNADGSLLGTRGSDTDITAHWLAEKALEDSLANFRTFFESITDMIFVGNSGGKLIFANPAVLPTLGYSAEELMTMHLLDLHPGDQRQEAEAIFAAMLRGERASCLLPIVRKDGSLVPVETRVWSGQWNGMNCLFAVAKNLSVEQEAQQLFERLFRSNPSLMALSELSNRRFSDANDAFLHTLGYSRAEIVGKTAADLNLFPNEEQQTAAREYLLSAGRVANVELQIQRKDGKILIGLFSGEIIRSQGRQFFLTVMNNITELKQMQSALKESNDRLHMAAQAGGVGIWDYNVLDNQLVWDDQMFRLYGIQRSQFSGEYKDLLKGVHPADQQRGHEEIQLALRGGGNFDTEFRVVWPNGSIHDIRALAVVQRDAAGLPLRLIGTNWDITAEKLAATTLRWNQELLQLMASSSPLGFLVVDNRTDAILHFNQRFCAIWGIEHLAGRLRRGELKNNDLIPYCLPALSDVPAFAASCAPLQDEANRIVLEDEIAFTGHRTIRRFTTQIRDAADRYYGRFYIFEDISERKNREALSASLLEREREVSEMKSRFISTMSHEFRTPMAAAMGSTELLANHFDRFAPEKRRELLGRVSSSIQRMTIMLDEVLLLSQLEGKRVAMRLTPIELSAFLRDAVEDIQLGDRDAHRFEFCPAAKVATIFADPKLLHHIFSNVLSNAVRYSPPGTLIKVRIEADDQQVWVAVQDRGIGILPADLARIFKPFERGANVGNIPGTGIGLNLVKQMTEMLGGTIAADPVADGGTCFTLVFPSHPASGTSA